MGEREPGYGSVVVRVGLTGTLGAGKSTVGKALGARGAVLIDADQVARDVTAPGSPGEKAVLQHFGERATARSGPPGKTGQLDRKTLADIVFSNPTERLALEAITHPLIRAEVLRRVALAESETLADGQALADNQVVVIEVPLLDKQRKLDYGLDVVVLIDAPEDMAVQRAVGRGMTEMAARARMAAQPSGAERQQLADRALVNDGNLEDLEIAVDELWSWLLAKTPYGSG
jgi:dephospho-CoA kinase